MADVSNPAETRGSYVLADFIEHQRASARRQPTGRPEESTTAGQQHSEHRFGSLLVPIGAGQGACHANQASPRGMRNASMLAAAAHPRDDPFQSYSALHRQGNCLGRMGAGCGSEAEGRPTGGRAAPRPRRKLDGRPGDRDSTSSRQALEGYLLRWGMDVTVADCGAAALHAARSAAADGQPFRVALVDMHMPTMNGLELAAALATDPATSRMATVLLTTSEVSGGPPVPGVSAQLTKPVRRNVLRRCVSDLVQAGRAFPPSVPDAPPADARRVLLAEDNLLNQKVTVAMLKGGGYQVDVVANGVDAVAATKSNHYDVVLMDCHMPKMDGLQATAAIRAAEGDRRMPIIALTAAGKQEDKDRCLAAGMDDHLAKPVTKAGLLAAVARWAGHPALLSTDPLELLRET